MKLFDFYKACQKYRYVSPADIFDLVEEKFHINKAEFGLKGTEELEEGTCKDIFSKLEKNIPVAYILGFMSFSNLKIKVTPDVLIPRPETEELVEIIRNNYDLNTKEVLDLCTGSGCIASALKQAFPKAKLTASDISLKALEVAKENAQKFSLDIQFIQSNYLKKIKNSFDFIVCNPPYIPLKGKTETQYEPPLALFSGEDGCDSYRSIFKDLKTHLKKNGTIALEIEPENCLLIQEIAKKEIEGSFDMKPMKDLERKDRFIFLSFK